VGPVAVQVRTPLGLSNSVSVTRSRISPTLQSGLAVSDWRQAVRRGADARFLALHRAPGMIQGVNVRTRARGDTVSIYAIGLRPNQPSHTGRRNRGRRVRRCHSPTRSRSAAYQRR
jgi:hypothetical protein